MVGKVPIGEWELALPDTPEIEAVCHEQIDDILFVNHLFGRRRNGLRRPIGTGTGNVR